MFKSRWFPWKILVRKMAKAHGFLDPIMLSAQLQRFTQPSEVQEPIELLRAGAVMHARGLLNSRVIQHNLDWVWPYWVEEQFNPNSPSFVPRAFSLTHINLTHRNWTAVGVPDNESLPIVDPRGLLTPLWDKWSLDAWLVRENGELLVPSKAESAEQYLSAEDGLSVHTKTVLGDSVLSTRAHVEYQDSVAVCVLDIEVDTDTDDQLAVSLRPYNPEGISFIHDLELSEDGLAWTINKEDKVFFDRPVHVHCSSNFKTGDVYSLLREKSKHLVHHNLNLAEFAEDFWPDFEPVNSAHNHCQVGMLSAVAVLPLNVEDSNKMQIRVPLNQNDKDRTEVSTKPEVGAEQRWNKVLEGVCQLQIPDSAMLGLYNTALHTLILHSVEKVYPGPYTYKRFWYRDATFIINALLSVGLNERAEQALDYFPEQQTPLGYFHSQAGEWDSNGQALWVFSQYCRMLNTDLKPAWRDAVYAGAKWLDRKREDDSDIIPHGGLLPAGFSAEHLGPNDHYYWDDYWAVAGLSAASYLAQKDKDEEAVKRFSKWQSEYQSAIERSLLKVEQRIEKVAIPASPYRRLDSGAIGSIVCGYPLQLVAPNDEALQNTIEFMLDECMVNDGFFQDMIHSGINPYLTLHIAQVLLRAGDLRFYRLMQRVAELASSTGQWPEAIHPHTDGGCMGDGQHAWAAAEWVLMIRHCFVREEGDALILAAGVTKDWWGAGELVSFGPAPTHFGTVSITIETTNVGQAAADKLKISWDAEWHANAPDIEIHLPGFNTVKVEQNQTYIELPIGDFK